MENVHFFGESEADDCPRNHPCHCKEKSAFMTASVNHGSKSFHIDTAASLPSYKIKSYGAWNISTQFNNLTFENFRDKTKCGKIQRIFKINPFASDNIPVHNFKKTNFINVTDSSVAFLMDPDPGWANLDDCGPFPCTAPSNVVMRFTESSFSG